MSENLGNAEMFLQQDNKTEAAKQVAAFNSSWERNKTIMSTFIRHSELDTVNLSAAKLKPYLKYSDTAEFCAESESLRFQLHHIWETEKFSIDNVL